MGGLSRSAPHAPRRVFGAGTDAARAGAYRAPVSTRRSCMARLCWSFGVISCAAVISAASRVQAEPERERQPMTWHAAPAGSPAGPSDSADQTLAPGDDAARATDDGRLSPFTMGTVVPRAHAGVTALGGYD